MDFVKWRAILCILPGIAAATLIACSSQEARLEATASHSGTQGLQRPAPNPLRNAYFGDLHLHTRNSFDAYIFNVRATPDDAYAFAKGGTIRHVNGQDIHMNSGPLDFLAVTDHSEFLGALNAINTPGHPYSKLPYANELFSTDLGVVAKAFTTFATALRSGARPPEFADLSTVRTAWAENIEAARRNYEPGKFTTFVAYEFTSAPGGHNLHRNVIFKGDAPPALPFTAFESQNPENLWRWLDTQRAQGIEALAIPHNSNGSDGWMFQRTTYDGQPVDRAWAEMRARNEPLVEITQTKGTSETHPMLSPNDEFAGFEIMEWYIGRAEPITRFDGGYVRKALRDGLDLQDRVGVNPYKMGIVAASDSHNAAATYEENNYTAKSGVQDATPELRGSAPPKGKTWASYDVPVEQQRQSAQSAAAGLTGVWAEENTREAIYDALRRKETFGTTGPRIRVRFFAGYDLKDVKLTSEAGVRAAYARGVPMGGDIPAKPDATPDFLVMAMRDTNSAPLQRLQIVKGWTDGKGNSFEKVFDVACADGLEVNPATRRCPDNGAKVDLTTCKFDQGRGDAELAATWRDPEFDAKQNAFYYARVIENPTCRWSTWDAIRMGVEPSPHLAKTIQERAYSSPIWFTPTKAS